MECFGSCINVFVSMVILIVAVVTDLHSDKIRNKWICVGILAGGVLMFLPQSALNWSSFLSGILIPVLIGWIPFRMRAIGAGDVKLFIVIGCLNGGRDVFYCIFLSFLLAAGISLGRLLSLRQLKMSLMYCFQYFQKIFVLKRIEAYPGKLKKGHTIHFSIAVLFGYAAWLGVKVCKIVPLF